MGSWRNPSPPCPRLFTFTVRFSKCFWFYPEPARDCQVPTLGSGERLPTVWDVAGSTGAGLCGAGWSPEPSSSAKAPVLGKGHMWPCVCAEPTPSSLLEEARDTVPRGRREAAPSPPLAKQKQAVLLRHSARSFSFFPCRGGDQGQVGSSGDTATSLSLLTC